MKQWMALSLMVVCSVARTTHAQTNEEMLASAPAELRNLPELPTPSPEIAARVPALRAIATQTLDCWSNPGERSVHLADRRCPRRFAQLARGGAASVHAIGQTIADFTSRYHRAESDSTDANLTDTAGRLLPLLAATQSPEAVHYLVVAIANQAVWNRNESGGAFEYMTQLLLDLTGYDAGPMYPWEQIADLGQEGLHRVALGWVRWFRAHRGEPMSAWRSAGQTQALAWLQSSDPVQRVSAIRRMITVPAHRAAAARSLCELLASTREMPAEEHYWLLQFARRNHVSLRGVRLPRSVMPQRDPNETLYP